jgi:hypothetical protein
MPPTEASMYVPQIRTPQIDQLIRQRDNVRQQIEDAREELASLTGDGGEGGRPGAIRPPGGDRQPDTARRRQELERRITGLERQLASVVDQLTRQGWQEAPGREEEPAAEARATRPLLESGAVRLWAHDLTVQPGKTYRYRMVVSVNNPAFARESALSAEQQDMARRPMLQSRASAWSGPIEVLDDQYFFVRAAQEAQHIGQIHTPATANVEVFRFFYGYYRRGTVRLEPGDLIASTLRLPESEMLPIFDLGRQEPGRNGERPGAAGGEGQQPEAASRPWTDPVIAVLDQFLVDVASIPGSMSGPGQQIRMAAHLRGENGGIMTRYPDVDMQNEVYRRVLASAQEGETQGEPVAPVAEEPTQIERPDRRRRDEAAPGGDGGSGG